MMGCPCFSTATVQTTKDLSKVTEERVDKYLHGLQGEIDKYINIETAMKRHFTLNRVKLKIDGHIVGDCRKFWLTLMRHLVYVFAKVKRPTIKGTESNSYWLLTRPLVELYKEFPHAKGSESKGPVEKVYRPQPSPPMRNMIAS
eukprot:scaffold64767_cov46-Prasinocladus_malaysianus.AAC.1